MLERMGELPLDLSSEAAVAVAGAAFSSVSFAEPEIMDLVCKVRCEKFI